MKKLTLLTLSLATLLSCKDGLEPGKVVFEQNFAAKLGISSKVATYSVLN